MAYSKLLSRTTHGVSKNKPSMLTSKLTVNTNQSLEGWVIYGTEFC